MDSHSNPEPVKRLSLNLPARLHTRFKTACSANDRTMMNELLELVARRTEELEREAGLGDVAWTRQHPQTQPAGVSERRLRALDRALECNHPTGDIEEMLADIDHGRDLR